MNLVGKKILVIHDIKTPNQEMRKVYTGIIVGCNPEIGICVAHQGMEKDPWCVLDGPLSPNFKYSFLNKEQALELNNLVLNQLKSGYISVPLIKNFVNKISSNPLSIGYSSCPYSM